MKDITTEEGKQEFVTGLAVRYKQVKTECERVVTRFIGLDVTVTSLADFNAMRSHSEKAYLDWATSANAIVALPPGLRQAFNEEYGGE